MNHEFADRLKKLPPYLFQEIDAAKKNAIKEGRPVIDLGIGDPDIPTPDFIVKRMQEAVADPSNHRYALDAGLPALKEEMAAWYKRRFNVDLDPATEILPLMGSKDGIAHIPLAFVGPGDTVLASNPGYPPYNSGAIFAGGEPVMLPLKKENDFLPDLSAVDKDVAKRCRIMHINYPNNPTGAVCDKAFYQDVVKFARDNDIIVCSDAAYTEISHDGYNPPSFLEADGAKEVGIEFHSLSKTFNMTGWRVGMAVGNKDVIAGLAKVKGNVDSGVFTAIQHAAIEALKNAEKVRENVSGIYTERRDVLVDGLNSIGWKVKSPKAAFYIWAPVFGDYDSSGLAKAMLEKADLIMTPGLGFGKYGEGYVRMALTVGCDKMSEAVERIKNNFFA